MIISIQKRFDLRVTKFSEPGSKLSEKKEQLTLFDNGKFMHGF